LFAARARVALLSVGAAPIAMCDTTAQESDLIGLKVLLVHRSLAHLPRTSQARQIKLGF
jgi:hypothetical protein